MATLFYIIFWFQSFGAVQYQGIDQLIENGNYKHAFEKLNQIDTSSFTNIEMSEYYELKSDIQEYNEDQNGACESAERGLVYLGFNSNDPRACRLNNSLSFMLREMHKEERAINHSREALRISKHLKDSSLIYQSFILLGNAFRSYNNLDSAQSSFYKALQYVDEKNIGRLALCKNNIGTIFLDKEVFDSALINIQYAKEFYETTNYHQHLNLVKINEATALMGLGQLKDIEEDLDLLYEEAKESNWLHNKSRIINLRFMLIAKTHDLPIINQLNDSLSEIDHKIFSETERELTKKYETTRISNQLKIENLENLKNKNTIRYLSIGLILLTLFGGVVFYNIRLKNKLKQQQLIIYKQKALQEERTRIASEMHDDLGGGLTTIKFLSQKVLRKAEDDKTKIQVQKIADHSQTLVNNMSEIIWAMNAGFDSLDSFIAYSRRYASEYLMDHEIKLDFKTVGKTDGFQFSGEKRRNLFLVIKEALHNTVKHADASLVTISIFVDKQIKITYKDNGLGFSGEDSLLGHGMRNMEQRVKTLMGDFNVQSDDGVKINITVPLENEPK